MSPAVESALTSTIPALAGVMFAAILYFFRRQEERYRQETKAKLKEAESRVEREPGKAQPAWDLARTTLEAYFNKNLNQIACIFWLSIAVMLVGFGMLLYAIMQSVQQPTVLAPSYIAGIITEFIGATFLFVYRSTIQQAVNYSKTLERINSVGMAMQILDTMPDDAKETDLKSATKSDLVRLLVKEAQDSPKTPRTTGLNTKGKARTKQPPRKVKSRFWIYAWKRSVCRNSTFML